MWAVAVADLSCSKKIMPLVELTWERVLLQCGRRSMIALYRLKLGGRRRSYEM